MNLLSPEEAAKYLGKSRLTVFRYRQLGLLPSVVVAGRHLYLMDDLEELKQRLDSRVYRTQSIPKREAV